MKNPLRKLEKQLGYRFRRKFLLHAALTHRSFRFEDDETQIDNQRMEFLGDAALGLLAAAWFYKRYPQGREGELTQWRSRVTSSRPLAEIGAQCGVGSFLRLGKGESQNGGQGRPSNLTDAVEAILGAAYLDGGIKAVEKIFTRLLVPYIEQLEQGDSTDNPKGALQEITQQRWKVTPRYRMVSESGPSHDRHYTIEVVLNNQVFGQGYGSNKRDAQMAAAAEALISVENLERLPSMACQKPE